MMILSHQNKQPKTASFTAKILEYHHQTINQVIQLLDIDEYLSRVHYKTLKSSQQNASISKAPKLSITCLQCIQI